MMRRAALFAAPTLLSLLAALLPASALAQVTLGRLFSTPAERATMDASRGAAAALPPNSQGQPPVPGTPGGPAAGGGQPQSPVAADPPMPGAGPSPAAPPSSAMPGNAATPETPPPPSTLVMSGVLRRSDNRTTVWLNDEPHYGAQKSTSQRPGAATPAVTVTLPSGRKIILKAGQRYDLTDGRIKDINEP
jgi:hypothetical protein